MFGKKNEILPDFEMFTLYDSKARIYREPMLCLSSEDMVRQIQNLFRDPAQKLNVICTNPEDFALFKIGTFSKKTGEIVTINHEHVANVHDLKPRGLSDIGLVEAQGALSST